jgi:putative serine protease PepD
VLAGLAGLALLLGAGTGGAAIALALDDDPAPRPVTSLSASPPDDEGADASGASSEPDEPLSQVADAVLPSVVSIGIETARGEGEGSGVIISEDGLILTNNHVAAEGEGGTLTVLFHDGTRADAEIVGLDPQSDLAVIQAQDVSGLTPATLGSSDDLNVGDTVLAIGSPLGLDGSVTAGIVSALNRAITLGGGSSPFGEQNPNATSAVIDAIQTDAAINPGNSGGALINARGEVVGINTAIASAASGAAGQQSGNIGVGFAIPIDDARSIADQLIEDGTVTHAYMGVQIRDADTGGALLGAVESGSPAEDAGLQEGDIVTAVEGDPVTDATDLTAAVRGNAPGDRVAITYTRAGDENEVEVTLGTLPTD